ncbi:MAG TPA: glycosyltransferase family 4 protein [Nitrospirota bacterium]|nr:glycosyltransferase family 4 protein [Nitrospirota bacterium]
MIVENQYPHDIRVRKEAEALKDAGYSVIVIALRGRDQKAYEEINDIKIYRIPIVDIFSKTKRGNSNAIIKLYDKVRSIVGYVLEYAYFTFVSYSVSLYIFIKNGFDVIHMHNPPDTLFMIGIFYKFLGKKYVFDHHDLSPELYLTRVSGKRDIIYKGLIFFERLSCRFSDIIISTNESYRQVEITRYAVNPDKIFIVRNNPLVSDCILTNGGIDPIKYSNKKIKLLFLGSINPQDGVDVLLRAIHFLVYNLKEKEFICNIVGGGDFLESVKQLSAELWLTDYVDFKGQIYDREKIKEYLWLSDIGVEPAPCNEANEHSTFIKVMEFMAAGKPVVAFDLKETRYSADGAALFVQPGDIQGFSLALKQLINDPDTRQRMGQSGFRRIEKELNWKKAATNLAEAYAAVFQ